MMDLLSRDGTLDSLNVLCFGAHCDDIEIGCGGTLLMWIKQKRIGKLVWVVFSSNPSRYAEALSSAEEYLQEVDDKEIIIMSHRDAHLQFEAEAIKAQFENVKSMMEPDVVFTHCRHDRHQDHRLLSDLAWNTFRNHLILEYEIPKYDGDLGAPNTFVAVSKELTEKKIHLLMSHYKSQAAKHWFDEETFKSLMRIRGLECNSASRYAEAFYMRKCLL